MLYLTGCKYGSSLDLTSVRDTGIVQICTEAVHGNLKCVVTFPEPNVPIGWVIFTETRRIVFDVLYLI